MRSLKPITAQDYYAFLERIYVEHHICWYADDIWVESIQPRMIQGKLYRLYLSDGKERIVDPTFELTIERY